MLEILLMDDDLTAKIAKLIQNAESNHFDFEKMKFAHDNRLPIIPEDCYDFEIELPTNIRVVFTIEEHPKGLCKHISISQDNDTPSNSDLLLILNHFGFTTNLNDKNYYAYIEKCKVNGKNCKAVNVIEPY